MAELAGRVIQPAPTATPVATPPRLLKIDDIVPGQAKALDFIGTSSIFTIDTSVCDVTADDSKELDERKEQPNTQLQDIATTLFSGAMGKALELKHAHTAHLHLPRSKRRRGDAGLVEASGAEACQESDGSGAAAAAGAEGAAASAPQARRSRRQPPLRQRQRAPPRRQAASTTLPALMAILPVTRGSVREALASAAASPADK